MSYFLICFPSSYVFLPHIPTGTNTGLIPGHITLPQSYPKDNLHPAQLSILWLSHLTKPCREKSPGLEKLLGMPVCWLWKLECKGGFWIWVTPSAERLQYYYRRLFEGRNVVCFRHGTCRIVNLCPGQINVRLKNQQLPTNPSAPPRLLTARR